LLISESVLNRLGKEDQIGLSTFSLIEIAQKNAKPGNNLGLTISTDVWFRKATPSNLITQLPITPKITVQAYDWKEDFHGDPADRIIAATAAVHGLTLITSDTRLIKHPEVQTLRIR